VLTEGVVPSLHVQYKKPKGKQYHKGGHALRTETTLNDTYDFEIGRARCNLPALREIGFAANRRLLRAEYLSHDCSGAATLIARYLGVSRVNDCLHEWAASGGAQRSAGGVPFASRARRSTKDQRSPPWT
jgi:hypothetical protein